MGPYSSSEVERILGVKDHVIRAWEREIPVLAPRKGVSGRREYGLREIALLLRVRHFVQDRGMGLKAARNAILAEAGASGPDAPGLAEARAIIAEVRAELARLFLEAPKAGG